MTEGAGNPRGARSKPRGSPTAKGFANVGTVECTGNRSNRERGLPALGLVGLGSGEGEDGTMQAEADGTQGLRDTRGGDLNFLALTKPDGERYFFLYDDEHKSEALRTLGRWASNPDLGFSWYDAATLSAKIRDMAKEAKQIVLRDER